MLAAAAGIRAPDPWQATEDLEAEVELAEERLAAVSQPDPLARPSEALAYSLAEAAEDLRLDVKRLLGLRGSGEWYEFDLAEVGREPLERLFQALCKRWETDPEDAWGRLRAREQWAVEKARSTLERRRRQEERVRMLAAVPDDRALERVLRYEAHLSREFARTLDQLEKARGLAGGMNGEEAERKPAAG